VVDGEKPGVDSRDERTIQQHSYSLAPMSTVNIYITLPLTCFSKIQIGFTFPVQA